MSNTSTFKDSIMLVISGAGYFLQILLDFASKKHSVVGRLARVYSVLYGGGVTHFCDITKYTQS